MSISTTICQNATVSSCYDNALRHCLLPDLTIVIMQQVVRVSFGCRKEDCTELGIIFKKGFHTQRDTRIRHSQSTRA